MNEPFGSDIANGMLYVADRDGGTTVERAERRGGPPLQHANRCAGRKVSGFSGRAWFNDIEVADDGTVYATVRAEIGSATPDSSTWQLWKPLLDGTASIFVQGAPLRNPNGVAIDPRGNIVVVNVGDERRR